MTTLRLCRFDGNRHLQYGTVDIETVPYVAISHVWGSHAEWRRIPGIPAEVLCSHQKARFIHRKLPSLVEAHWFWMDILSVNQAVKEARIAVVGHIPAIYRSALKTIAVREEGGLAPCCKDLFEAFLRIGDDKSWYPQGDETGKLKAEGLATEEHIETCHSAYFRWEWMERLWTLQEMELSNTIQFTVCEAITNPRDNKNDRNSPRGTKPKGPVIEMVLVDIQNAAKIWAANGRWVWKASDDYKRGVEIHERLEYEFYNALLYNGTVQREVDVSEKEAFSVSPYDVLRNSINSTRKTSKARDFILAIFPNFRDCMRQIEAFYANIPQMRKNEQEHFRRIQDVRPKFTKGILSGTVVSANASGSPSPNVPVPDTLGDFSKLLYSYSGEKPRSTLPPDTFWKIRQIGPKDTIDNILHAASSTMWHANFATHTNFLREYFDFKEKIKDLELVIMLTTMNFLDPEDRPSDPEQQDTMGSFGNILRRQRDDKLATLGPPGIDDTFLSIGMTLLSARRGRAQLNDITNRAHAGGADPSQASSDLVLSFDPEWQKIRKKVLEADTPEMRSALLHIAAHSACGLAFSAMAWTRTNLRPFLLVLHDAAGPVAVPSLARQTMFFGAPGYVPEPDDEVLAYDGLTEPYVMVRSRTRGEAQWRVVGLLPETIDDRPKGTEVILNYGCPEVKVLKEGEEGISADEDEEGNPIPFVFSSQKHEEDDLYE